MDSNITLIQGDCLVEMDKIADGSIDCVIADTPYGTTACAWDSVIDLDAMWKQLKRVIKPNGAIVLFCADPFTSVLITSNLPMFKYRWVWEKTMATNFLNAKNKPMTAHEDIAVFSLGTTANKSQNLMCYYPQMGYGNPYIRRNKTDNRTGAWAKGNRTPFEKLTIISDGGRYPRSVILFANGNNDSLHPTQKPIDLLRYLIRTYTKEGDTVLDFTMGSGSTLVACIEEKRNGIGIEMDAHYFQVASERIQKELTKPHTMKMELA